jgi:hypothetical protein
MINITGILIFLVVLLCLEGYWPLALVLLAIVGLVYGA